MIVYRMTSARGSRYYTPLAYAAAKAAGTIRVRSEEIDAAGNVSKAEVIVTSNTMSRRTGLRTLTYCL